MQHIPVVSHVLWMGGTLILTLKTLDMVPTIQTTGSYHRQDVGLFTEGKSLHRTRQQRVGVSGKEPEVGIIIKKKSGFQRRAEPPPCFIPKWFILLSNTGRCASLHVVQRILSRRRGRPVSGWTAMPLYIQHGMGVLFHRIILLPQTVYPPTVQPSPLNLPLVMQWCPAGSPWDKMAKGNDFVSLCLNDGAMLSSVSFQKEKHRNVVSRQQIPAL